MCSYSGRHVDEIDSSKDNFSNKVVGKEAVQRIRKDSAYLSVRIRNADDKRLYLVGFVNLSMLLCLSASSSCVADKQSYVSKAGKFASQSLLCVISADVFAIVQA